MANKNEYLHFPSTTAHPSRLTDLHAMPNGGAAGRLCQMWGRGLSWRQEGNLEASLSTSPNYHSLLHLCMRPPLWNTSTPRLLGWCIVVERWRPLRLGAHLLTSLQAWTGRQLICHSLSLSLSVSLSHTNRLLSSRRQNSALIHLPSGASPIHTCVIGSPVVRRY